MSNSHLTRRQFLRTGAVSAALASATHRLSAIETPARAKSCILLMLVGGPSQLETFDPKPDVPAEVRGPFRSVATRTTAHQRALPRLAVVESM